MDQGITQRDRPYPSNMPKDSLEQMDAFVVSEGRSRCPSRQAGILLVPVGFSRRLLVQFVLPTSSRLQVNQPRDQIRMNPKDHGHRISPYSTGMRGSGPRRGKGHSAAIPELARYMIRDGSNRREEAIGVQVFRERCVTALDTQSISLGDRRIGTA